MKRLILAITGLFLLGTSTVYAQGQDFTADHTAEITSQVEGIAGAAQSITEEMNNINNLAAEYGSIGAEAETQFEANNSSQWPYVIWDTELNSLWSRLESKLDAGRMEALRADELNWITIKDMMAEVSLADYRDGSMYPMLLSEENARITRNRAYHLASILAEASGEPFEMPEKDICGTYVDNQGTDSVYSSLVIGQSMESGYTGSLTIFRMVSTEGTVTENGDTLLFTDDIGGLTGEITYGWDGATFTVTGDPSGILTAGSVYEFPMVI